LALGRVIQSEKKKKNETEFESKEEGESRSARARGLVGRGTTHRHSSARVKPKTLLETNRKKELQLVGPKSILTTEQAWRVQEEEGGRRTEKSPKKESAAYSKGGE